MKKSAVMTLEYEYRYPASSFDLANVVKRAKALGARRIVWSLLVNHIFVSKSTMVRLREVVTSHPKLNKVVMTLKSKGVYGFEQEYETAVDDMDATREILLRLGLEKKHTMEKIRGTLEVPDLGRIDFDWNPGIPIAMEVESPSKAQLDELVARLALSKPTKDERERASLEGQYHERYGVDPVALKACFASHGLSFDDPVSCVRRMLPAEMVIQFDRVVSKQISKIKKLRKLQPMHSLRTPSDVRSRSVEESA